MGTTVSATEARVHLGELMRRVAEEHEPIVVERNGQSRAVLVPAEEYGQLRAEAPENPLARWLERVDRVREQIAREGGIREPVDIAEIIRQGRDERDRQIFAALGYDRPPGDPESEAGW